MGARVSLEESHWHYHAALFMLHENAVFIAFSYKYQFFNFTFVSIPYN